MTVQELLDKNKHYNIQGNIKVFSLIICDMYSIT